MGVALERALPLTPYMGMGLCSGCVFKTTNRNVGLFYPTYGTVVVLLVPHMEEVHIL